MSIDRLRAHYGFTRMPFGKDIAPGALHGHGAHAEAVARISWCISEQAIGVITGECGAGKTVAARAAVAGLDASRHTILYLGTPGVGLRGIYGAIVTALGGTPRFHHAALIPQAQELLAAEASERGKQVVLIIDEAHLLDAEALEGVRCLSQPRDGSDGAVLPAAARPADVASPAAAGSVRRAGSADRGCATRSPASTQAETGQLHRASPRARRPLGHAVLRRRRRADPRGLPRPAQAGQQPRRPVADRRLRRQARRSSTSPPHAPRSPRSPPNDSLSLLDQPPEDAPDAAILPAPAGWPAPPARGRLPRAARRDRPEDRAAHRGRPRRDPDPAAGRVRRRRRPRRVLPGRGDPPSPQRVHAPRRRQRQGPQGLLLGPRPPPPRRRRPVDRAAGS